MCAVICINGFKQYTNAAAAINIAMVFKSSRDTDTVLRTLFKEHSVTYLINILFQLL